MTHDRSEIYELCPRSDEWPRWARGWRKYQHGKGAFLDSVDVAIQCDGDILVSREELTEWELAQEEEAVEKAFYAATQRRRQESAAERIVFDAMEKAMTQPATGVTIKPGVEVHAQPNTRQSNPPIEKLSEGYRVQVHEVCQENFNVWYRIGDNRWIISKQVRLDGAPRSQPPAPSQKWTDEVIEEWLDANWSHSGTGGGLRHNKATQLAQLVRNDTADERDAYWQEKYAELEASADKTLADAGDEIQELQRRIAELEKQIAETSVPFDRTQLTPENLMPRTLDVLCRCLTYDDYREFRDLWGKSDGTIAELEKELDNISRINELFDDDWDAAEKAAELLALWQAFATIRNNTTIHTMELMPHQHVGIYDDCGEVTLIVDKWEHATAWLKEQAQPAEDKRVSMEEVVEALGYACDCDRDDIKVDAEIRKKTRDVLDRYYEHGSKPERTT